MNTISTKINNVAVNVAEGLQDFQLHKKKSSNVAYFGIQRATNSFFVQYLNGACMKWVGVPIDVLEEAVATDSIGKLIHAKIKHYEHVPMASDLITIAPQDDDIFM